MTNILLTPGILIFMKGHHLIRISYHSDGEFILCHFTWILSWPGTPDQIFEVPAKIRCGEPTISSNNMHSPTHTCPTHKPKIYPNAPPTHPNPYHTQAQIWLAPIPQWVLDINAFHLIIYPCFPMALPATPTSSTPPTHPNPHCTQAQMCLTPLPRNGLQCLPFNHLPRYLSGKRAWLIPLN